VTVSSLYAQQLPSVGRLMNWAMAVFVLLNDVLVHPSIHSAALALDGEDFAFFFVVLR